ncbi:MAG: tetratricopeptide repeat protein [Lentimicrobium sp.]|jgi:signal transduction histidine kinase/Tfp pilus assembly protein PilF|uniref:tetratricopeptide repeat-containing sensor histidine kinase n=1 Tax=Lentimicrobium sp. TaxID=2034841 RepID=UPI0025CC589A|nr:tetratricopeptide repeat protein [Lentimicrobium sp.]MCO5255792.1 tetratricopeptide repeat protein [Lentimicrobium sp.]HPF64979.1 tetratricopeptide repeat protein [Lentimicrobium sp.]
MKQKFLILFACLILLAVSASGQQKITDSLERAIRTGAVKDTNRINALNRLAITYWYNDSERALNLSREAVRLSTEIGFDRGLAVACNILGVAFDIISEFDSALYYYEKAAHLSRKTGYNVILASALNNMGMVCQSRGDYKKAISVYLDALRIFEKLKDLKGIGNAYNNIGLVYFDLQQYRQALDYHNKALSIREKTGDKYGIGASLTNLGLAWSNLKDDDKALNYYERSLKIKEEIGDKYGLAILLNNMAIIYQDKNKLDDALIMYAKSENYHRQIGDLHGLIYTFINTATVLNRLGKFDRSATVLDSAMYYAREVKSLSRMAKVLEAYSYYYGKTGNYQKAWRTMLSLDSIKDSLYSGDMRKDIAELKTRYEIEKNEHEIAFLNQQNEMKNLQLQTARIRQRNSLLIAGFILLVVLSGMAFWLVKSRYKTKMRLEHEKRLIQKEAFSAIVNAEENERKRIAMELHDGLGQLLSAAKLNISVLEDTNSEEDRLAVDNAENLIDQAIADLRNISHNLMPSALIRLGLIPAIHDMADKINSGRKVVVKITSEGFESRLPGNLEIAIYRVIQESVNNILKHAGAGNIFINLRYGGESLDLSIEDDGKGMPEPSTSNSGKGIGWDDIRSRVSLFNGRMNLYSEPGKGTRLNINFTKSAL